MDLFSDKTSKTNNQFQVTNNNPRDEEIKCSNCDFVAKNENSLKAHMKADMEKVASMQALLADNI